MEKRNGKGYANATKSCGRNTRDGVQKHVSRACEKGIRIRMPWERTTATSVIGSCGVVRTTCRELDWDGESTNNTFAVALYKNGVVGKFSKPAQGRSRVFGEEQFLSKDEVKEAKRSREQHTLETSNRPSSPPRNHTGLRTCRSYLGLQTVSIVPNPPVRAPLLIVAA